MLKETGRVVAVDEDGLWVETLKKSACAKCAARQGCGQKLLAKASMASNMTFIKALFAEGVDKGQWKPGDEAVLGIEGNALVLAALFAYGVPLLMMIVGMFLGAKLEFSVSMDMRAGLGALTGLFFGGVIVKFYGRYVRRSTFFQAHVVGRGLIAKQ